MLVKKYEAKDMQQAMDDIVKELGSEAVILNSRKIKKKGLVHLFQKPIVEVMVAYEPRKPQANRKSSAAATVAAAREAYGPFVVGSNSPGPQYTPAGQPANAPPANGTSPGPPSPGPPSPGPSPPGPPPSPAAVAATAVTNVASVHSLDDIDSKISSLDHALSEFMQKFSHLKREVTYNFSPPVEKLLLSLTANQVREELAISLAKETEEILKLRKDAAAYEVMHHLICESISAPAPIALKKYKQKVILFLGPTGVGKTTSLVKLASDFALNHKKHVGIINTDTYRIAAHEQLRTYADILDIPLGIAYRMEEVEEALVEMQGCDVVFIDTAGKRPNDPQHRVDVGKIIEHAHPEDIFLCVAAPTSFSAITEIIDTYDFVGDYKLLITKLDETKHRGMILNITDYAKRPLAYVTTGQNVPDDLEAADTELLAKQILER